MDQITSLKQAWIFDNKGALIQQKTILAKSKATQVYRIAKQALYHAKCISKQSDQLKRISFVNGKQQWTITGTPKQIIVMQKKMQQ